MQIQEICLIHNLVSYLSVKNIELKIILVVT